MDEKHKILVAGSEVHNRAHFAWYPIDKCQYQCSYCSSIEFIQNKFKVNKSHNIVLAKLKLADFDFEFELLGGEPTLHPDIHNIISEANSLERCRFIELVTNLARSAKFFKSLDKKENNKLVIAASYHYEYHGPEFIEKCIDINNSLEHVGFHVSVNLSDEKKWWKETLILFNDLETNNIEYSLNFLLATPEWKPNYPKDFYDEFRPFFKGRIRENIYHKTDKGFYYLTEEDIYRKKISYKGMHCTQLFFNILMDGNIYDACSWQKMPILLKNENIKKGIACDYDICVCDIQFDYYKRRMV